MAMHQYVLANDVVEIMRFINHLRQAVKDSKARGGGYSCFLHNQQGDVVLQIEVALPITNPVK